jgi:hypothetical protein
MKENSLMSATFRSAMFFLCLLCFSTLAAQDDTRIALQQKSSPVITAAAAEGKFRFSSPAGAAQMRVQIASANGDTLFDSAWKSGNVFDWPIDNPGQPLANGLYRCVVMVSDLEGRVTQKEATFVAHDGQVSIEPRAGTEGLTIVGTGENGPKITMLTHDDKNGAIVNTSGDLIFRFGKFFAGSDTEKMRLTADGNLGIGTDKPQTQLDVNGLIRTSKGIMFSDGTILTTAAGSQTTGTGTPNRLKPSTQPAVVGAGTLGLPFGSANHLTPRTNTGPGYQFLADTTGVHIGTTTAYGLDVAGNVTLSSNLALAATSAAGGAGVIMQSGLSFAHTYGVTNTFLGGGAGNFTMTGTGNTGVGRITLRALTTGVSNTGSGFGVLASDTTGSNNTAVGFDGLNANNGDSNTAIGYQAMVTNSTGGGNIAIGTFAGSALTTGSNNIDIGNDGAAAEGNTIRIGNTQARAFIAGIRGVDVGASAFPVVIDANGQLGTTTPLSSRRYKFDISSMDDSTDGLMRLRPVTFRYLAHGDNAPLQYGLIAEEVNEVYPELVVRNKDGEVETVMYQFLAPMLLNEVQKQHRQIEEQQKTIEALSKAQEKQQKTIDALSQQLEALASQRARSK